MTTRPHHPGPSTARAQDVDTSPDVVTVDPDLALARWENEGGHPDAGSGMDEASAREPR